MDIHIVCTNYTGNRILPRLAQILARYTGWTLSDKPVTNKINYAFPYLELTKYQGQFISLFTHREDCIPEKVKIYKNQAARSILRITWAKQYLEELEKYGPAAQILPPLDRDKFRLCDSSFKIKRPANRLICGVSGFVYSGGRKGEGLLKNLLKEPIAKEFEWMASGRGWPVKTILYPYADLESFYWNLDVYICLATIEGVPYPPLEAMACGIRCIIPRGVGLLDDLPDLPDLIRYEKGNVKSLTEALIKAKNMGLTDQNTLREATRNFTNEGWVQGNLAAVSKVLQPGKSYYVMDSRKLSDCGIFTVAYGKPAKECAVRLIESIRKYMPDVPVAVASDSKIGIEDYFSYSNDLDLGGRIAKIKMYDLIPPSWQYAIYLDADTELIEPINFIFDALKSGWELVISKDINDYDKIKSLFRRDKDEETAGLKVLGSDNLLQLAGGVIGFKRCNAAKRFFDEWLREWRVLGRRDQGALLRSLYKNPLRIYVISDEWNSFIGICDINRCAGVLHHRNGPARRWQGHYPARLDNLESMAKLEGYRVSEQDKDKMFSMIALKTFATGGNLVRKGSTIEVKGEFAAKLIELKLAFCLK